MPGIKFASTPTNLERNWAPKIVITWQFYSSSQCHRCPSICHHQVQFFGVTILRVEALSGNLVHHCWTKHIKVNVHFTREKVTHKELEVRFVPNVDQIANVLTKPISQTIFEMLRSKLPMCDQQLRMRGNVDSNSRTIS